MGDLTGSVSWTVDLTVDKERYVSTAWAVDLTAQNERSNCSLAADQTLNNENNIDLTSANCFQQEGEYDCADNGNDGPMLSDNNSVISDDGSVISEDGSIISCDNDDSTWE